MMHHFHGVIVMTSISVMMVMLVKLFKFIGSRMRQHDGRVTVHGIGKTRSKGVVGLLGRGVF